MDPHMQSRSPSSSLRLSFKAVPTRKMVEEEGNDNDWAEEEEEEEEEQEEEGSSGGELLEGTHLKKKRVNLVGEISGMRGAGAAATAPDAGGGTVASPASAAGCQAEKCKADLTDSKRYHKRHKVCEYHAKAQVVIVAGQRQRFCQQCSRFHELSEFDEAKRSCRRRLAGHNERRRKHSSESRGVEDGRVCRGSSAEIRKNRCRQVDQKGRTRTPVAFPQRHQNFDIH